MYGMAALIEPGIRQLEHVFVQLSATATRIQAALGQWEHLIKEVDVDVVKCCLADDCPSGTHCRCITGRYFGKCVPIVHEAPEEPISNWDGVTLPIHGQEKKGNDHPTVKNHPVHSRCDPRSGECTHKPSYDINSDHDMKDATEYVEGTPVVTQTTKMWNGESVSCTVVTTGIKRRVLMSPSYKIPINHYGLIPKLHYEIKSDSLLIVDGIIFFADPVNSGVELKDGIVSSLNGEPLGAAL
jgi:hypothetical protein